jgi:hypothetical protein
MDGQLADPQFKAFVGSDLPGANTTTAMVNDVLSSVSYQVQNQGGISEILTDRHAFATDPVLASIYGVPPWDGKQPPTFPSNARVGLLTRAALLSTGVVRTRPIMKGLFIRTALMCDKIPDPPPNAALTPEPPLPPVATTREHTEALTQRSGTVCVGCHQSLLNPLGFQTENFDSLGRERKEESVYDLAGSLLGTKAIHTDAVPQVTLGDKQTTQSAADLTALMDKSRKVHSCFAEQYFLYTLARVDDTAADGCALSKLETAAMKNLPLKDVLRAAANLDEFMTRIFQ